MLGIPSRCKKKKNQKGKKVLEMSFGEGGARLNGLSPPHELELLREAVEARRHRAVGRRVEAVLQRAG